MVKFQQTYQKSHRPVILLKSHFILRVIDEPALRMAIESVPNGIEHVHRFTRAVSVGDPRALNPPASRLDVWSVLQRSAVSGVKSACEAALPRSG